MLASVLFSSLWPMLSAFTLTCHQPEFACTNSPVSCDCQGFIRLTWSVVTPDGGTNFRIGFGSLGQTATVGRFSAVVCNATDIGSSLFLSSKVNFTLSENINVECSDNTVGPERVSLQVAGNDYSYVEMHQC